MARDFGSFDLFEGLGSLSKGNKSWFSSLNPDGQKAAAPFVITRWMTGTSDAAQIIRLNELVNPYLFAGSADKEMLFSLIAIAATGKSSRYNWVKGPGSKMKKLALECTMAYYECSAREASTYRIAPADLIEMAEELGWDKEQITKLEKEVQDGGSGAAPKERGKSKKPVGRRA
jgi:hypothetical protein